MKDLILYFKNHYEIAQEVPMKVAWGRHGKLLKTVVDIYGEPRTRRLIDHFFRSNLPGNSRTLERFVFNVQDIAEELKFKEAKSFKEHPYYHLIREYRE